MSLAILTELFLFLFYYVNKEREWSLSSCETLKLGVPQKEFTEDSISLVIPKNSNWNKYVLVNWHTFCFQTII